MDPLKAVGRRAGEAATRRQAAGLPAQGIERLAKLCLTRPSGASNSGLPT